MLRKVLIAAIISAGSAAAGEPPTIPADHLEAARAMSAQAQEQAAQGAQMLDSQQLRAVAERARAMSEQMVTQPLLRDGSSNPAGIASSEMLESRNAQLAARGLAGSDESGRLYIFVSTAMPEGMLRAYADEARHTGAILVVRGIPAEATLDAFVRDRLVPLARAGVSLQIDPRLFDTFQVSAVPSIVYTTLDFTAMCNDPRQAMGEVGGGAYPYEACAPAQADRYWKVGGAVTLFWALQAFEREGADVARFIDALRARGAPSEATAQGQVSQQRWAEILSEQSAEYLVQRYFRDGHIPSSLYERVAPQ